MKTKLLLLITITLFGLTRLSAQSLPPMYGVSKMTFLVSSFDLAHQYYNGLLGFDRAFAYDSPRGKVVVYKINDRQFLEFIEDKQAKEKNRFVSMTIQTPELEQMHKYLISKGATVTQIVTDAAKNRIFTTKDDRGKTIEFADMNSQTLYAKSRGKFLSQRRVSTHMHHAGMYLNNLEDNPYFWTKLLGFKELVRVPEDHSQPAMLLYYVMPGTTESIEFYNSGSRGEDIHFEHPCFTTMNMQQTMDLLRSRDQNISLKCGVGRTNRWILNITNSDGTKVEFTEPYTLK